MVKDLVLLTDKLSWEERLKICFSEILATATLVFIGCMGCVVKIHESETIPDLQPAFCFGIAVMVAVQCFGHISGAHINPVVSLAAIILKKISVVQGLVYFVGQMLGAMLGFGCLMTITPAQYLTSVGVCSPYVNPVIGPAKACFTEFFLSLLLVWICCAIWDERNSTNTDSISIRFGLAVAVFAAVGGGYSGANLNPARSFAPALFNGTWDNHWVYWVGPLLAPIVGATLYRGVFGVKSTPVETGPERIALNTNDKA